MNEINEIELKLPQALFNKRFCKSTAEVQHSSLVIQLYICAEAEQKFFKAVPSQSRKPL
jgi:hypothetical protein